MILNNSEAHVKRRSVPRASDIRHCSVYDPGRRRLPVLTRLERVSLELCGRHLGQGGRFARRRQTCARMDKASVSESSVTVVGIVSKFNTVRASRPRHSADDPQAVFGGRKNPHRARWPARQSHDCGTVPARGHRGESVLQLVERVPRSRQAAAGGRHGAAGDHERLSIGRMRVTGRGSPLSITSSRA